MEETRTLHTILLVDDDTFEAMVIRRVLRDLSLAGRLVHVADAERALLDLQSPETELPGVILLDLNMPRMTGLELLEIIKADGHLKDIPVIVVTTSQRQEDMTVSFALGAAAYVVKSSDYPEFCASIRAIARLLDPQASEGILQATGTPISKDSQKNVMELG